MTFESISKPSSIQTTQPTGYLLSSVLMLSVAVVGVLSVFTLARAFDNQLRVAPEFTSAPATEAELPTLIAATVALGILGALFLAG